MRWYIAMSAEVLAQCAIVGFADFAFLDRRSAQGNRGPVEMYTHHKFNVFAKSEADYSKHSLELVVGVIDASRGVNTAEIRSGREMNERSKQIRSVWRKAKGLA